MFLDFKKYFLLYTVLPLFLLAIGASYYRFMVQYDYLVLYEGPCDPYTEICFEYCEDEECSEPFHYTWLERKASTLVNLCGEQSVLDCDASLECLPNEAECSVTYCDPVVDEDCEFLSEEDEITNTSL